VLTESNWLSVPSQKIARLRAMISRGPYLLIDYPPI
jgi:hypothetical protein